MNQDVEYVKYSIFHMRILRKLLIAVSLVAFSIFFVLSSLAFVALRYWDATTLAWPINEFYDLIAMIIHSCVFIVLAMIISIQIGRVEIVVLKKSTEAATQNNLFEILNRDKYIEIQTLMKFKKSNNRYKLFSLSVAAAIILESIFGFSMKLERILIVPQAINLALCFMIIVITVRNKFYTKYFSE